MGPIPPLPRREKIRKKNLSTFNSALSKQGLRVALAAPPGTIPFFRYF